MCKIKCFHTFSKELLFIVQLNIVFLIFRFLKLNVNNKITADSNTADYSQKNISKLKDLIFKDQLCGVHNRNLLIHFNICL